MYESNFKAIFDYLRRRTGRNEGYASDLAQETFEDAYKSFQGFKAKEGIPNAERVWLYKIAHSTLVDFYRREGRMEENLERGKLGVLNEDEGEQFSDIGVSEKMSALRTTLDGLPDRRKLLLYLRLTEGLTYKEVAYIMASEVDALKSLYNRTEKEIGRTMRKRQIKLDRHKTVGVMTMLVRHEI